MRISILTLILFFTTTASALYTELGLNYNYKKTVIDSLNQTEQQGSTVSVSFYFWEHVALELSYTNSLYVKKERNDSATSSTSQRVTTQYADIYGTDLIYVLADKKAPFQPYIKGGGAYISKRQVSQVDNNPFSEAGPYKGWAPSYGVGLKFFLSETFAIRAGWDVVRTPIDNTSYADDLTGRVGVSWML
ncbi:MAG: hypothetical protein BroJett040_20350 [Oligoflexia bacterium]|nr:MAG: hypothetical protein BroJett040_20350 [Oligoflexia bacterium]